MRVLDEDGNQLGVLPTHEALRQAQERGLDLVEVAPTSAPPVCKYLNYGQYKYELQKKEKDSKKRQKTADLKELRCTPKIGEADLQTKIRQAHKFLSAGDRVKFSVKFRGREMTHPEIGQGILTRVVEGLSDVSQLERPPAPRRTLPLDPTASIGETEGSGGVRGKFRYASRTNHQLIRRGVTCQR